MIVHIAVGKAERHVQSVMALANIRAIVVGHWWSVIIVMTIALQFAVSVVVRGMLQ